MKGVKLTIIIASLAILAAGCPKKTRKDSTATAPIDTSAGAGVSAETAPENAPSAVPTGPPEEGFEPEPAEEDAGSAATPEPARPVEPEYGLGGSSTEEASDAATSPKTAGTGATEESGEAEPEEGTPATEAQLPAEISWLGLEKPNPPAETLAKFRGFWLGMTIETWARVALKPESTEGNGPNGSDNAGTAVEESGNATPEKSLDENDPAEETAKAKPKRKPLYRELPLVLPTPGVKRYIYTDPTDRVIDHITFRFFKDELYMISVYYRSSFFAGVLFDDFLSKLKDSYGEPTSENWRPPLYQGALEWDDGSYNIKLSVFSGLPFSLILTHNQLKKAEGEYIEKLKKTESAGKIEGVEF